MTGTKTRKPRGKTSPGRAKARIAVIGGSGLYHMGEISEVEELRVKTPFGDPSDAIVLGTFADYERRPYGAPAEEAKES